MIDIFFCLSILIVLFCQSEFGITDIFLKVKKGSVFFIKMSDEADACECVWSHEFAMQRLLAFVC